MMLQNADFTGFIAEAKIYFKDRIYTDYLRRFAYGVDASCYSYVPKVVVCAIDESEIIALFTLSAKYNAPLTFKAAGTSLSGQVSCDNVLVLANFKWQNIIISDDKESIFCDCGVIGSEANDALKPFGKKIGPDPATINNAMIGGIFSNNSSGMCCGTKQNSYQTIKSIRVILRDGFVLDTSIYAKPSENIESFLKTHKDIAEALLNLHNEIIADKALSALIARKFAIKNTTGYSINALLDFDNIKDILNHIFIGAEGTLGFVSRVEYECVKNSPFKACALIFYANLQSAAKAVEILAKNDDKVSAAEIMDYACLLSAKDIDGAPKELQSLKKEQCALLVQLEDDSQAALKAKIDSISALLESAPSLFGTYFSSDEAQMAQWWKIRKALLPLSASLRPSGSIVITEDICFPIESFAKGLESIAQLFEAYQYNGIIFGHALSGNAHFIITPTLADSKQSQHFGSFMESLSQLVIELKGSIKAEHGTGRMVAPFVEKEWGKKAYAINRRIKAIFDPHNLINPDVIITNDAQIHLKNLKNSTQVEDFINQCMECGFCEKICPSRELTLTPRQRIAVWREITRLEHIESKSKSEINALKSLKNGYKYLGIDTCATCSMCATLCPLEIDTAMIAKSLKPQVVGKVSTFIANQSSAHFSSTVTLTKAALKTANALFSIFGTNAISHLSKYANLHLKTPFIPKALPRANALIFAQDELPHAKETHLKENHKIRTDKANRATRLDSINHIAKQQKQGSCECSKKSSAYHSKCEILEDYMRHSEVSSHSCHTEQSEKSSSWYIERNEISTPCHTEPLGEVSNESSQNFQRDSSLFAKVQNEQDSVILSESEVSPLCHIERSEISNKDSTNIDSSFATQAQNGRNYEFHKYMDSIESKVLYMSACLNRAFAPSPRLNDQRPLQEVFLSICQKADIEVLYPQEITQMCCGKAYKDYPHIAAQKAEQTYTALLKSVKQYGNIAIVCDHSACSYELMQYIQAKEAHLDSEKQLRIYDMPQFIESIVLKRLLIVPKDENIALYAMCATRKGKWSKSLESIAKACVNGEVIIHHKTQCCGFAGNKGFSYPELNASALRELNIFFTQRQGENLARKDSANRQLVRGFASSSTCEIGLNEHTHIKWQNLLYLLDEVSQAQRKAR